MFTLLKTALCAALMATAMWAGTARADDLRVAGTGATFPAPMYAEWIKAYNAAHPGTTLAYTGTGSGAGIKAITDRTTEFGASDAPMSKDQEAAVKDGTILHLPMLAGPEVMIYNLPGVANLKLNAETTAGIYLKQITKWSDPKLTALNPGVKLPDMPIIVAHRSDGSGTSYIFTDYLSKASADWKVKVGKGTTVEWPVGLGGPGNPGVAQIVTTTTGAIGYVEWAFANKPDNKLPYASMVNKAGKEVTASIEGVIAAAAASVTDFPADLKVSITNAPGDASYPICGFTYLLVYQDLSYMKDKAKAQALVDYAMWCVTEGQKSASNLGYASLPTDAQAKVIAKIKSITFDGQPLAK